METSFKIKVEVESPTKASINYNGRTYEAVRNAVYGWDFWCCDILITNNCRSYGGDITDEESLLFYFEYENIEDRVKSKFGKYRY